MDLIFVKRKKAQRKSSGRTGSSHRLRAGRGAAVGTAVLRFRKRTLPGQGEGLPQHLDTAVLGEHIHQHLGFGIGEGCLGKIQ